MSSLCLLTKLLLVLVCEALLAKWLPSAVLVHFEQLTNDVEVHEVWYKAREKVADHGCQDHKHSSHDSS